MDGWRLAPTATVLNGWTNDAGMADERTTPEFNGRRNRDDEIEVDVRSGSAVKESRNSGIPLDRPNFFTFFFHAGSEAFLESAVAALISFVLIHDARSVKSVTRGEKRKYVASRIVY